MRQTLNEISLKNRESQIAQTSLRRTAKSNIYPSIPVLTFASQATSTSTWYITVTSTLWFQPLSLYNIADPGPRAIWIVVSMSQFKFWHGKTSWPSLIYVYCQSQQHTHCLYYGIWVGYALQDGNGRKQKYNRHLYYTDFWMFLPWQKNLN